MDATDRNIGTIFDMNMRIVAPLFQRPYVWNQEKNWDPLWEAIQEVADSRLISNTARHRFLGAIVLDQLSTQTGEVEARQVIDGQQRLTTLQVALSAMRDLCREVGADTYHEAFKRLTVNFVTSKKSPESTFKVWPTNKDRQHFSVIILSGSKADVLNAYKAKPETKDVGHLIPNAYLYFYESVKEWVGDAVDDVLDQKLESLLSAMRQDLLMVVIDLGERDDAQMIFETLNALGTPLLPADLVKNYLFHRAESEKLDIEELYAKYWSGFDEKSDYWRKQIRQGRLNRPRIDLYLQHYLTLQKQEDVGATHLFAAFKDYVKNGGSEVSIKQQLVNLHGYAETYEKFETFPQETREGLFFYRLEQLDTNTVYPVLLEVFKNPVSEEDKLNILEDLESYLVRRVICGLTQKNYNRFFVELVKRLSEKGFTGANVREYLLAKDADTSRWPTDQEVQEAVITFPLYRSLKRANLRMLLEAIEMHKRDAKSEKIKLQDTLTIEHLLPQEWVKNWKMPAGSGLEDELARDRLLHTIGNLTLLTKKLNPSVSNSVWEKKKRQIAKHSALALNREIVEYDTWDESVIKTRSKAFSKVIKGIWSYPQKGA